MPALKCPFTGCEYLTEEVTEPTALALLTIHSGSVHQSTPSTGAQQSGSTVRVEQVKRPTIRSGGSSEDWTYFKTRWSEYTVATKVSGQDRIIQLLECCEEELRKDLTRNAGCSLSTKEEDYVLNAIKQMAVKEENVMISRMELFNMHQDHNESIRSFGARIRGRADTCKYIINCTAVGCTQEVSYKDHILRDILIRGVADQDIRLDILQSKEQDLGLEEVFKLIEAMESGKRSALKLDPSTGVNSSRNSQYKKNKQGTSIKGNNKTNNICSYCNQSGHGVYAPSQIRQKECPAFGKTCSACGKQNHLATACRKKSQMNAPLVDGDSNTESSAGEVFEALCSLNTQLPSAPLPLAPPASLDVLVHKDDNRSHIALSHHMYNQLNDMWVKASSKPQPFIKLTATLTKEDYEALGFKLNSPSPPKSINVSAMADTGCQSCLASSALIQRLGLSTSDLIRVSMKMHAANNDAIEIIGAVILRFSGESIDGAILESRQVVYVTKDSNKLFLSREACIDLGIISPEFPKIGEASKPNSCEQINNDVKPHPHSSLTQPCSCPKRQLPPPIPKQPPIEPIEKNRQILEAWLLEYYKSSTFNVCDHQPLPMIEGPPLRLMINPDAKPTAHHKPIPVPLHWQQDVKEGLDQDCRLGVIEVVPVGEPTIWCHLMVTMTKKNNKLRRTVDLQLVNK